MDAPPLLEQINFLKSVVALNLNHDSLFMGLHATGQESYFTKRSHRKMQPQWGPPKQSPKIMFQCISQLCVWQWLGISCDNYHVSVLTVTLLDNATLDLDSCDLVPQCSLCRTGCSPNDSTQHPIIGFHTLVPVRSSLIFKVAVILMGKEQISYQPLLLTVSNSVA